VQTDHVSFRLSPGDGVDPARQEAHYAWATALLGVSLPSQLQYFKYRDREQMARLTGQPANGFAVPGRLEVHAIFEWDAHEALHVYSALLGRPSDRSRPKVRR
jgi:hypothetical protein